MARKIYLKKEWQQKQWSKVRDSADPRYTKEVNVNLPIKDLFEGLGRTKEFFQEIKDFKINLEKEVRNLDKKNKKYPSSIKNKLEKIEIHTRAVIESLDFLSKDSALYLPFNKIPPRVDRIFKYNRAIYEIVNNQEQKEIEEAEAKRDKKTNTNLDYRRDSEYLSSLKYLQSDLRKLSSILSDVDVLSKSLKAKLSNDPFILLLGNAGMGKTHLLCDLTLDRLSNDYSTIMVLGEEISKLSSPIKGILKARNIREDELSFLREINKYGEQKRRRVLLIIDAINESDIAGWKKNLREFKNKVREYSWVGIVLSCRTPFENIIVPKKLKIHREYHRGFNEYEFEAMKAYFKHYKIPLPEVPLLISEFSSPLFLSSFCKTAISLRGGRRKVAKKVKDIALGQTGMTTILEDFYDSKQKEIFKKHETEFKGIVSNDWLWDKTSGKECLIKFLAKAMANNKKEFLELNECLKLITAFLQNKYNKQVYKSVLEMLVQHGVVIKDLSYSSENSNYIEVIKFPFQKFSDHLVARYFLENYLDINKLKKSFSPSSPLGDLFKDENSIYSRANLAEAIIVEFPERVKRNRRVHEKDIIDYLPKDIRNLRIFREIYISALYWRKPDNFNDLSGSIKKSTIAYFNDVLLRYKDSKKSLLGLFITTAVKPRHPLSFKSLSNWLTKMTLPRRDIFWTEYLRSSYATDPAFRLLNWIEEHDIGKISEEHAEAVITILSWFLGSTSHSLRNRATKCIYDVGSIHPKICFQHTVRTFSVNDPYVQERMLASSYGVSMKFSNKAHKEFDKHIADLAKNIFDSFFSTKAVFATTHIYIRDYARGIIELALYKKLISLNRTNIKRIRPPYKKGGIRSWGRSIDKDDKKYRDGNSPMGMDFANYTLGRLVNDRNNYDFTNKDYVKVKENMFWRLYQLGYSLDLFGDIDKEITSSQRLTRGDYPGKVDRYGKKYSWIAYNELWGYRLDTGDVRPMYKGDSFRESNFDPSFPLLIPQKYPVDVNLLRGPKDMKNWLKKSNIPDIKKYIKVNFKPDKNTWVLIEGTIDNLSESTSKKNSVFIEGIFVDKKYKNRLKKFLKAEEWLDNYRIPDNEEVRAEYLGELGWHPDYNSPNKVLPAKFVIGYRKVKLSKREKEFRSWSFKYLDNEEKKVEMPEYRDQAIYIKINISRPARYCHAKDYRYTDFENTLGLYIPSNNTIKKLELYKDPETFNFNDKEGKLATISVNEGRQYKTHKNLLYIRKDLLKEIKKKYKKDFFLCAWGERQYWPENFDSSRRAEFTSIYQSRKNQHIQFIDL